jgi:2-dehydro-3-deoxyphosphogluconate aldolase/(4S)-4-hydroxy-2-oxoglutarate aldolase
VTSPRAQSLARIQACKLLPILRLPSDGEVLAMSEALLDGGLPVIELSLTMPNAVALIADLVARYGERASIGAGTVLTIEQVDAVAAAGASFMVSPVTDPRILSHARHRGLATFPGALTPTEVVAAWSAGADAVKVFPCHSVGGANYLRALKAPLPDIPLLPTGGIHRANALDHLAAGAMALGMGSDLVDLAALRAEGKSAIEQRARDYLALVGTR